MNRGMRRAIGLLSAVAVLAPGLTAPTAAASSQARVTQAPAPTGARTTGSVPMGQQAAQMFPASGGFRRGGGVTGRPWPWWTAAGRRSPYALKAWRRKW